MEYPQGNQPSSCSTSVFTSRPARSIGTQAPDFVHDHLDRVFQGIRWAKPSPRSTCPVLERLTLANRDIQNLREKLFQADCWLDIATSTTSTQRKHWEKERTRLAELLAKASDYFWELNVANPEERARQRLQEYLNYKERLAKVKTFWTPGNPVTLRDGFPVVSGKSL